MTAWRKSSYSVTDGTTDCVELAHLVRVIGVRDSKNPEGDHLAFSRAAFGGLLRRIKGDELDIGMRERRPSVD
ncbi:MAG TPA: DUF397 domain-containing protein [Streptosporangiaceae bacterium]